MGEMTGQVTEEMRERLMAEAERMRSRSYAPYSEFCVGAALLAADGTVFTGCNVENAAYSPANCAERTAFFKAVSEGVRQFSAIAIAGGAKGKPGGFCPPCGVCRQVMMEFCDPERFEIILKKKRGGLKGMRLSELLPFGFGPEHLDSGGK